MRSTARMITFTLGGESYAIDLMSVRQVLSDRKSTPVPTAPEFVEGIVVLRNEVIPVIDLRKRLYPTLAPSERSFLLVSETADRPVALRVDQVKRIITVSLDAILAAPELVRRSAHSAFLIGVIDHDQKTLLVLDLEAVLTRDEQELFRNASLVVENEPSGPAEPPNDRGSIIPPS